MLDPQYKGQQDRLVHSINVTFDDNDCTIGKQPQAPSQLPASPEIDARYHGASAEEANDECHDEQSSSSQNPLYSQLNTPVPDRDEHFDTDDPSDQAWFMHPGCTMHDAGPTGSRPRPSYNKMCALLKEQAMCNLVMATVIDASANDAKHFNECMKILTVALPRHQTNTRIAHVLATHAQKDMDWQLALKGPDRDKAIAALEAEMTSLQSTILTEIKAADKEYKTACELATPGRLLLSTKRNANYKSRGVKQGFKEDTEQADGPNFNYYAHVAKFNSIRMSIFRMNRGNRRIAIKDVSTAFLQSDKYPDGTVKYVSFKDPLTLKWHYYKQSGPLYGEKSASRRWEDTIAPWYESIDFKRGKNEPCAFLHALHDALVLLWTDDNFIDAEEDSILWTNNQLDTRFDCRGLEWLIHKGPDLDYIGMQMFQTEKFTALCLEIYIKKTLDILGQMKSSTTADTPICKPIDGDSKKLDAAGVRLYMVAIGSFGWMANTCRPDIAYAHSRMAQHLSNPTESAWQAVVHCCNYLRGTSDLCIAAPMHQQDRDPMKPTIPDDSLGWEFFCDSDFAGNCEEQNKRRSQSGFIALLNGAPVLWGSKVSSVCFAHPDIGEAHADISSGAAGVYAAGKATFEFLHLSYTADEMVIPFPKPFTLQIDNKAAIAFADNSAFKSKLKHIDVRQEWVQTLRNHSIINPVYVPSEENLADIFTKILDAATCIRLRDRMMFRRSSI